MPEEKRIDSKIDSFWNVVPVRDFQNLSAIQEKTTGEIVATVKDEFAEAFATFPELVRASRDIFEKLSNQHPTWGPNSPLGRLEQALKKLPPIYSGRVKPT